MKLTVNEIVYATGGRCLKSGENGDKLITGIHTDTRSIVEGALFVPLKGERFDGHQFISQAFSKGAIASLTENLDEACQDDTVIWVADTQKALLDLAHYYRKQCAIPVIAVTGSVGKTTTKDLIAAVLSAKYNTLKTEGNFNNEIGMPLTVFRLKEDHELAVVELGMNHFGEIHRLSMALQPDVAVITNIGVAHIENLGSQEGILKAKLEILDGLKEDGPLILNGDDTLLQTVDREGEVLITYGQHPSNNYSATNIKSKGHMTYATVKTPRETYDIVIPALGEHMVYNTLVAIAVAEKYKLTKEDILKGLMAYIPSKMRMNIETSCNNITIIDDAYNASPDSMKASLKVLNAYETKGRRIAILGDMFEMGEHAPGLHQQVGEFMNTLEIDVLYTVGRLAKFIAEGARKTAHALQVESFETKEECINTLKIALREEDVILLKASRGMEFEEIVKAIRKVNDNE